MIAGLPPAVCCWYPFLHLREETMWSKVCRLRKRHSNSRGSITGILIFYHENGATTPSNSYKIILEHQEKEINWIFERNNSWPALVYFGNGNGRTWKQLALTFFKLQFILTKSICGQRHSSIVLVHWGVNLQQTSNAFRFLLIKKNILEFLT